MTNLAQDINREKVAGTAVPIDELLAQRWSPRAFAETPVPKEKLLALFEAARWAPSCFGDQPWRYIVCERGTAAWDDAFACLSPGNKAWTERVPVLLLAVADSKFSRNGADNRWGAYDTGAASMSLVLEATAQGLCAHQMGGFDIAEARARFAIPASFTPMAVIAIGYQAPPETLDEELAQRERAPRERRPLNATFFAGKWEHSF